MGRADGAISASATHQSHLPAGQLGNLDQSLAAAGEDAQHAGATQCHYLQFQLLGSSQIFSDLSISLLSLALSLAVVCCCSLFVVRLWV